MRPAPLQHLEKFFPDPLTLDLVEPLGCASHYHRLQVQQGAAPQFRPCERGFMNTTMNRRSFIAASAATVAAAGAGLALAEQGAAAEAALPAMKAFLGLE